jgi:hypothetical protein
MFGWRWRALRTWERSFALTGTAQVRRGAYNETAAGGFSDPDNTMSW